MDRLKIRIIGPVLAKRVPRVFVSIADLFRKRWTMEETLSKEETEDGENEERYDKLRSLGIRKDPKAQLIQRLKDKARKQLDGSTELLIEGLRSKSSTIFSRYKDKIEFAGVTLAANIPSFLLSIYCDWYVWMPGTVAIYAIASHYPAFLKLIMKNKISMKKQKRRETFATADFVAGIPAVLVEYTTFNLASNGGTNNHVIAVSAAWLAARFIGWPTWIYLWKKDNPGLYEDSGWKTGSIAKSFFNGLRRKFSTVREGAANEIMEQVGYARTMDWPLLLTKPLLMQGILLYDVSGEKAFAIYGIISGIIAQAFYAFYFNPKFFPEITERLMNKEES